MRAAMVDVAPPLDIELVGVPLDLGASYRMGARRDVHMMLRGLDGQDIVSVATSARSRRSTPCGISCINAANLMFEITCLVARACGAARK